jgi:hypothetical protein
MAKVSIRVQSGAARFDVAVVADSVEQTVSLVRGRYRTSNVRVKSRTGLVGFPVDGRAARTRADGFLRIDALAA